MNKHCYKFEFSTINLFDHIATCPICFRKQVELLPNFSKGIVTVKQLGGNSCFVGENELKKGETTLIREGDVLCLVQKDFPHVIEFVKEIGE